MKMLESDLTRKAVEAILGSMHDPVGWNGHARKVKLGADYEAVQAIINALMEDERALIRALACYVLDGHAGSGEDRQKLLGKYYKRTQVKVNWLLKTANAIASGSGAYGNGEERRRKLGDDYIVVQSMVNQILAERPLTRKELDRLVAGVWAGDYGKGEERKEKLGARYEEVQKAINGGLVIVKAASVPKLSGKKVTLTIPAKGKKRTYTIFGQANCSHEYLRGSGCALCAGLCACSADSQIVDPDVFYDKYAKAVLGVSLPASSGRPVSPYGLQKLLSSKGIRSKWVPYKETGFMANDIIPHLRTGQPVLVWMGSSLSKKYTNSVHTVVLAGVTEDGRGIYLDSGARTWDGYQRAKLVDLNDVQNHMWFCTKGKAAEQVLWGGHSTTTGYIKIYF